jgi:hypothetical protein
MIYRIQLKRTPIVNLLIDIRVEMEVEFGVGISDAVLEVAYSLMREGQMV